MLFVFLNIGSMFGQTSWQEIYNFQNGLAREKVNNKYGFINQNGTYVISCKYNHATDFKNGLAEVLTKKKGYVDDTSDRHLVKAIIDTNVNYVWISPILGTDGLYSFFDGELGFTSIDGKFGVVNRMGQVLIPFVYDYKNLGESNDIYTFSEDLAAVVLNDKIGFVNKEGILTIPCVYDNVLRFSEGVAAVSKNGLWGFINYKGEVVIPIKYHFASSFHNGLSMVSSKKSFPANEKNWNPAIQYGFINKQGEYIFSEEFVTFSYGGKAVDYFSLFNDFKDSLCIAMNFKMEHFILYPTGKKILLNNSFNYSKTDNDNFHWSVENFSEGLCKISSKATRKYGFMNRYSEIIIPCLYDDANSFLQEGLITVKSNNKWGVIDSIGRLIIPFEYDNKIIF